MKPEPAELAARCPEVDSRLIQEHLARLSNGYFERFDTAAVGRHLQGLTLLGPDHPVEAQIQHHGNGRTSCTVLAFDHPGAFSLITGVLASCGFSILSGDIFTYAPAVRRAQTRGRGKRFGPRHDPFIRRRIIDHFYGIRARGLEKADWDERLRQRLHQVMRLLESDDPRSVEQAKHQVNEWVTETLSSTTSRTGEVLYPVQIAIDNQTGPFTRLHVISQDTPAFLYSLSTALALHDLTIERVRIQTLVGQVMDEIDVLTRAGEQVRDLASLDQIRLSVLLTKQFTHFLDRAPDPYTALARFEQLTREISARRNSEQWLEVFANPKSMEDLARLLGASDFLWEDFIRSQYETLLPILGSAISEEQVSDLLDLSGDRLRELMQAAANYQQRQQKLNEYKDRQLFLIDLAHILSRSHDLALLAERLTALAERVLRSAMAAILSHLESRFGSPRAADGTRAEWALFGLGKLGGVALGYASDLELLLVFREQGETDGQLSLSNAEFFGQVMRELLQFIEAKREGMFQIDLKLRPYGIDGPLACHLSSFEDYYGPGGPAHSLERLSLTRLRVIGGDADLGAKVEAIRDGFIYDVPCLNLEELRQTRLLQFEQKQRMGAYNAKYSPGGLVDVEYAVQILQVLYGKNTPELRTPRTLLAMEGLKRHGIVSTEEQAQLSSAYDFLTRLVNGLRMLRGSAEDLFLPPADSEEYVHLARRMGYQRQGELAPAQQLSIEFQVRTATVRAFVERRFGPASLPGPAMGTIVDLIVSDRAPAELRQRILQSIGFRDVQHAYSNLRRLAGEDVRRDLFAQLVVLAAEELPKQPDPDMTLDRWRQMVDSLEQPEQHFRRLLLEPPLLGQLLGALTRSEPRQALQREHQRLLAAVTGTA